MKKFMFIALVLLSTNVFANSVKVDVLGSELGMLDNLNSPSLCLTVVRVPESGEVFGVVESIEDCFYARQAKKNSSIEIDLKYLAPIDHEGLREHLQKIDSLLEFYFSDGE